MNLLFVNSIGMWGGAERWFLDSMGGLAARGHDVRLACRPGTPLEAEARRRGFTVHAFPIRLDLGISEIRAVRRLLAAHRVDLLLVNRQKELRFAGVAARLAGGVPVVARRAVDEPLKNSLRSRLTWSGLATHILANSEATRASLRRDARWLDPARVTVIHNGIDPRPFEEADAREVRRRFDLPPGVPLVGFVGLLDRRKGVAHLLEAFLAVRAEHPAARLMLVGAGKLRGEIEAWRRARGLEEAVILAGFQPDTAPYLRAFDLLVLPSLWEGFGYVLVEAMAAGRPVVTTATSSMPEIVRQGVDGLLVPPADPAALARAIGDILRDRALARWMGDNGHGRVRETFTLERMLDETEALFERLVAARRPAAAPAKAR